MKCVVGKKKSPNLLVQFTYSFDCQFIVHHEFIPEGKTVNKESTLTSFIALGMPSKGTPQKQRTNFVSSSR